MLLKAVKLLFFSILFLAVIAFFLSSVNERNLLAQTILQSFNNFITKQAQIATPAAVVNKLDPKIIAEISLRATLTPTLAPTKKPTPADPYVNDPDLKNAAWGQAIQVSETGYRMKVGFDSTMATATETFQALNHYRYTKGKSNLTWDDRLAKYALERATYICKNGSDGHAGFSNYVDKQEGYKTLGFYSLGENMSTHMRFTGTHLIEWMYAADPAHDGNQLGDWSHVGVGIYEDCSALIFGNLMI